MLREFIKATLFSTLHLPIIFHCTILGKLDFQDPHCGETLFLTPLALESKLNAEILV